MGRLSPGGGPPSPAGVRTYDELTERLRALRAWAGVSYRELHRRVVRSRRERGIAELPAFDTVHRHFQPGRRRVDAELIVDIASVLLGWPPQGTSTRKEEWRQACRMLAGQAGDAAVVEVFDALPADLAEFTGRASAVERLLADHPAADIDAPPATWLIYGMAGAGKTTLAIHVAHQLLARGRGGDVQLFVNLRGYDPELPPADPLAVLDGFLRRLGLPGNQIHRLNLARRRAKLRELLLAKRALLVLDNAAGEEQVRSLLPDSPACLALVTSRRRLEDLPAVRALRLDPFSSAEAVEMLRRGVGANLVDADPRAAAEIAQVVGRLPLALGLVVSRIRAKPRWSLRDHLERLLERRTRLQLDGGVEVALASSYDALPSEHQNLLRFLALHPGQDFDVYAASALAGEGLLTTERRLTDLHMQNLLLRRSRGRYELHDLVRVFAADRAADEDRCGDRQAAVSRLLDYDTHTSALAIRHYTPHETRRFLSVLDVPGRPGVSLPALTDRRSATAWLDAERANLIAISLADADQAGARLATVLFPYLYNGGHNRDAEIMLSRASHTTEPKLQAAVLIDLAVLGIRAGRHRQVLQHLRRALAISGATGDQTIGRAAEITLGRLYWQLGDYPAAAEHAHRSLDLSRQLDDRFGEAQSLGALGLVALRQGRYDAAFDDLERALAIASSCPDDPRLEMNALANLADLYSRTGRHREAIDLLLRALSITRGIGYPPREAVVLGHLGAAYVRAEELETGLDRLGTALPIARERGDQYTLVEVLNTMGETLRQLGQLSRTIACHDEALAIATDCGIRYQQARALDGLAHAAAGAGDAHAARTTWQEALARFAELGTPEAGEISRRLARPRPA